jgi:cell division initiation protein
MPMALTPLDVRKQQFRRVMRGVDGDEVAVFLGLVAGEMETLIREHAVLTEQVAALRTRVEEFQSLERSLRDAVVVAQGMREEARRQAEREAELLLSKADLEVKSRLRAVESRVADLKRELAELKGERQNYLIRLRALIETHMRMVEASEARFEALDSAGSSDARVETLWRTRADHGSPAGGVIPDGPAAPVPPNPGAEPQHPPAEAPGPWG